MPYRRITPWLVAALAAAGLSVLLVAGATAKTHSRRHHGDSQRTATPIKHVVVIFQENVSFDHYFGTYPHAANTDGEPFHAAPGTPTVNGLSKWLRTRNPNLGNPQRLTPAEAMTCDQDHAYTDEQKAFDHGIMDQFVPDTGRGLTLQQCLASEKNPTVDNRPNNYAVLDYYDGNTVTGLWNYAQHFAMSDNSWSDGFGPSTPGAINVTSGNTYGADCGPASAVYDSTPCPAAEPGEPGATPNDPGGQPASQGSGTTYSDSDPYWDKCSYTEDQFNKTTGTYNTAGGASTIQMGGTNIGDLLNQAGITWGWFQGGFEYPGYVPGHYDAAQANSLTDGDCTGSHANKLGVQVTDYSPHHEPFQYYASTANPQHLPPSSVAMIGRQDQANHQYDLADFWAAADNGNLPAVSYLKAAEYQDGHGGYSDPLDEQTWLADTINHLESLPTWKSTMVVVLYDDSDGWYDHQMGPILNQSQTTTPALDQLSGPGQCGANSAKVPTTDSGTPEEARCGVGMRQPLLVISPYSKQNFVDNHLTTQSSVVKFIEDNWLNRERIGNGSDDAWTGSLTHMLSFDGPGNDRLFLNPNTGEPAGNGHHWGH
jgi:phospholipase C